MDTRYVCGMSTIVYFLIILTLKSPKMIARLTSSFNFFHFFRKIFKYLRPTFQETWISTFWIIRLRRLCNNDIIFIYIRSTLSSFYQGYCSQIRACDEFQISSPLIRDQINVAIRRCIGNLKNTHFGAHWSVPRQAYIGAPMYGPSSNI